MKRYSRPAQFDGDKFAARYNLNSLKGDFWADPNFIYLKDGIVLLNDPPIFESKSWLVYAWTSPDPPGSVKVYDATGVDLVTNARIQKLVGGVNPDGEQIKQSRVFNLAQYAQLNTTWPDGVAIQVSEKAKALIFIQQFYAQYTKIEAIRTQGSNFKAIQGW